MAKQTNILLGVTGSIAAFRAAELVRLMVRKGWRVDVIMTRGATEFVRELTFHTLSQNPVSVDLFSSAEDWRPGHISRAEQADVFLVAPCTANVMAKLAHGIADDLLSCTALATTAPLALAPAMNVHMWENAATRANCEILTSRGITLIDVGEGDLACGYQGKGRMAEVDAILAVVERLLDRKGRP